MSAITKAAAEEMINNYRTAHPKAIKSFWLDSEIIAFIKNIENLSGIRVYPAINDAENENIILAPTSAIEPGPGNNDEAYFNFSNPNPPYTDNSIGSL